MRYKTGAIILFAVVAWKLTRTDWIVTCQVAIADFHPPISTSYSSATYRPHVSPFWRPPEPGQIAGRPDATWADHEFFDSGGSYGPISEPVLNVDWPMVIIKALGATSLLMMIFRKNK